MNLSELHRVGRMIVEASRRAMAPDGVDTSLSAAESAVMARLLESRQGRSIKELTALTGFVQSRVSSAVQQLRSRGWLETQGHPGDRRRTVVQLNPAVRRSIQSVVDRPPDTALAELLAGLPAHEQAQVIAALEILVRGQHPMEASA
ncbi:MAG: MarR family winged helix-turn-helix transcriptional regulator [Candidatus Dormibacteria bacterium]